MKKYLKWILPVFIVILIQFIPVNRINPPVEQEVIAPAEVRAVLQRSCYDCHSNETNWPWYSRVVPVSWLIVRDVREGRKKLNFSTWNRMDNRKKNKAIEEIWEEVEQGEMPLWFYLPLHSKARLTEKDLSLIKEWANSMNSESKEIE